jgi:hypothetical protein
LQPSRSTASGIADLALVGVSACYFDLQIIQETPQVKTQSAACAILPIALGFKQLAHGLHAVFGDGLDLLAVMAVIRIGLSRNFGVWSAWIAAARCGRSGDKS